DVSGNDASSSEQDESSRHDPQRSVDDQQTGRSEADQQTALPPDHARHDQGDDARSLHGADEATARVDTGEATTGTSRSETGAAPPARPPLVGGGAAVHPPASSGRQNAPSHTTATRDSSTGVRDGRTSADGSPPSGRATSPATEDAGDRSRSASGAAAQSRTSAEAARPPDAGETGRGTDAVRGRSADSSTARPGEKTTTTPPGEAAAEATRSGGAAAEATRSGEAAAETSPGKASSGTKASADDAVRAVAPAQARGDAAAQAASAPNGTPDVAREDVPTPIHTVAAGPPTREADVLPTRRGEASPARSESATSPTRPSERPSGRSSGPPGPRRTPPDRPAPSPGDGDRGSLRERFEAPGTRTWGRNTITRHAGPDGRVDRVTATLRELHESPPQDVVARARDL